MEGRVLTDKLLDLSRGHAGKIAEQWYEAVRTNPRLPSMQVLPREQLIVKAMLFYENLKRLYFAENPFDEMFQFLEASGYVEDTMKMNIPLHENVYALIMMRRHIWLYAESQAVYSTSLDLYQALQSINRTILIFDYAIFILTKKYGDLTERNTGSPSQG